MNNNERIKQAKDDYSLTNQELADTFCVVLSTVESWLKWINNPKNGNPCPPMAIRLLDKLIETEDI